MNMISKVSALLATILPITLAGCVGGTPPTPPPVVVTVGTTGGTVTGPSGAQVVIPAGALGQDTPIGIAQADVGAPALPTGTPRFGPMFALTPHGTVFNVPVTVTIPFDPTKVSSGAKPTLYKTNAARNAWEEVAGATVSGGVMTGQVTGFSDFIVTDPPPPRREWEFKAFMGDGKLVSVKKPPAQTGGLVDDTHPYDGNRIGNVHSTEDGRTYWALALDPKGSIQRADSQIGNLVLLNHEQAFRKEAVDALLKLTITSVVLDLTSFQASDIIPYECVGSAECNLIISSRVKFRVKVSGFDQNGEPWRFDASSYALLNNVTGVGSPQPNPCQQDWQANYGISTTTDEPLAVGISSLWDKDDFNESATSSNCGYTVKLKKPITVFFNLSKVGVGKTFFLNTAVEVQTFNEVQGESSASAYFRDPVSPVGGNLEYTGLTPVNAIPPTDTAQEIPRCATAPDPAAGTLQWSAPTYDQKEGPVSRNPILVTRTGGSKGAVSVRVTSRDDTASAGADYTVVDTVVVFADGDTAPRTIEVPIQTDTTAEPDKRLTLVLSDPRGCSALGTPSTAVLNILDNDRVSTQIPTFTVGGTVSGLQGTGLVLEDRATFRDLAIAGNGPFTFPIRYALGQTYDVRVKTQPTNPIQTCGVINGTGTVAGNVTNILVNCTTSASQGGLDSSFGSGGKATLAFFATEAMALQADGKIVMVGGGGDFRVTRFNADGSPDAGFGSGGQVTTSFPGTIGTNDDNAHAVAIQPDGKIVVVGEAVSGRTGSGLFNRDFALVRYNANGSLDTGFGTGGFVTTDFGGSTDRAFAVVVQPDGKIVVSGDAANPGSDFGMARYNPDGSLDISFDGDGKVLTDIAGGADLAREMALQTDGKIIVVGPVTMGGSVVLENTGLARYNTNGSLDTGFGSSGKVTITKETVNNGVVIQPDGKIVLVGSRAGSTSGEQNFLIRRHNTDGSLDTGFGSGGTVVTDFGAVVDTDTANAVSVQPDGKLVAVGFVSSATPPGNNFAIARYTTGGSLDTGFDGDGLLTVDFFGGADAATGVVIQPDGKIVVGGSVRNGASTQVGLVRIVP